MLWLCSLAYLSVQQVQIWRDTETLWRHALDSEPNCSVCHGNFGAYLSLRGDLELAKAEFQRVLELRPGEPKAVQHLGHTYASLGNFPKAIEIFRLYLKQYPNDEDALNNLGVALLASNRPREALEPLQRAVRVKPGHITALVNSGIAHADLREYPEALSLFRRAIGLKYDTPGAWSGLARVHLERGDPGAARTAWGILGMLDRKEAAAIGPAFLQTW